MTHYVKYVVTYSVRGGKSHVLIIACHSLASSFKPCGDSLFCQTQTNLIQTIKLGQLSLHCRINLKIQQVCLKSLK